MTRLALVPLLFLALAACDDFEGDLGHLWFSTNLATGLGAWTPLQAVAGGTSVQVAPGSIIGRETQPEHPVVKGSVKGGVARTTANCTDCVSFVGAAAARARVGYAIDGVYDEFRVRFEPAASFDLLLADGSPEDLAIVAGKEIPFGAMLTDGRGRPLGYNPDQVEVTGTGAVSAWQDEGILVIVTSDSEPGDVGTLDLSYAGKPLGSKAIAIVSPDEVVRTRKICPPAPQRCDSFVVAAFTKDGTRVLGAFDTYEGRPVSPWGEVDAR